MNRYQPNPDPWPFRILTWVCTAAGVILLTLVVVLVATWLLDALIEAWRDVVA